LRLEIDGRFFRQLFPLPVSSKAIAADYYALIMKGYYKALGFHTVSDKIRNAEKQPKCFSEALLHARGTVESDCNIFK
jgi:hypothetical protein